jgi:hypothetical protein
MFKKLCAAGHFLLLFFIGVVVSFTGASMAIAYGSTIIIMNCYDRAFGCEVTHG